MSQLYDLNRFVRVVQGRLEITDISVCCSRIDICPATFHEPLVRWELVGDCRSLFAGICCTYISCVSDYPGCASFPGNVESGSNFGVRLSTVVGGRERYRDRAAAVCRRIVRSVDSRFVPPSVKLIRTFPVTATVA